ncbi:MAG TPA: ADP-forming succinate--CoA ligase subunit beta [Bacillota bacterium]|nr:ADP-forming succinate--CoA ligase subunit beta [Bacillota bacterium]HOH09903.1 ADP-forming succinate--CoA ligase subunit beta [Bacillota bacterium]HOS49958.1 ADP-forming succinate--CoA ligase subunit beta [Bacillota bacterium]HOY88199.1 ADP-forming succinate--CoA ligase subunit beta [Bacillota bacterium]HPM63400.1 ADP-forming succinate--CoA ligase subunit beta [Bacillota bacterium]
MQLLEHQGKALFRKYGIPVPEGRLAQDAEEAGLIASSLGVRVAVKAQVLAGGRGKAGGILLAEGYEEAKAAAAKIIGMRIKGITVREVLVERALSPAEEYYVGLTVDRSRKAVALLLCRSGGVDIEEIARSSPEAVYYRALPPNDELHPFKARRMALEAGFDRARILGIGGIIANLYRLFMGEAATLAEINPLMVTQEGKLFAADSKMILDESALDSTLEGKRTLAESKDDELERKAIEKGLNYVRLEGDIGVIGNGAGLVMATIDAIGLNGGRAADFLDIGGGAKADVVRKSLELLSEDKNIKSTLLNIFGGITRCDEVAKGILEAVGAGSLPFTMVVRLAGTGEDEGRRLLEESGMKIAATMDEAAQEAVLAAKGAC